MFLSELHSRGRQYEAMTLCMTYIDSFAQWLRWPNKRSSENFVESLLRFGGNSSMSLIHPFLASQALRKRKDPGPKVGKKIEDAYSGRLSELISLAAFEEAMTAYLDHAEVAFMKQECWRITMANVVYGHLRNPSVHHFGSSGGIFCSGTTYQGRPFPGITFQELQECAFNLVGEARRRSSGQWFGNDKIIGEN